MSLRHYSSGHARPWQFQQSDHLRGGSHRRHVHGPILPMERPGLLARLFGRG